MDLSLIPTDELIEELQKRFGIAVILVLDEDAARKFFEDNGVDTG